MKFILESLLSFLAHAIITKYKPRVIGITGSVGKTSTKDAIVAVLKGRFEVRETYKNYNNELGLPLTIIGAQAQGKNLFGWLRVVGKALYLLLFKVSYPNILVLEMGADKPGDIDALTQIAPVSIGVLTAVSEAHLHEFKSVEKVLAEKEKIVTKMKMGRAIINADDALVASVAQRVRANVTTIGIDNDASMRALEVSLYGLDDPSCESENRFECTTWGTTFKISHAGSAVPFFLPH
ncbi:hypothetical protein IT409_00395, partial [Candidatus Falkowbacteria bacterium]|nr:hypothetical protein [Candidatus Falkowbacteria bacterium]